MMRILLVSSSLRCGGAERVITLLADHWAENGNEVSLVTFDRGEESFFPLSSKVKRIPLLIGLNEALPSSLRKIRGILKLRKIFRLESPDVIISFQHMVNVTVLISSIFQGIPVIVSERNTLNRNLPRYIPFLVKKFYPIASAVVVQTQEIGDWFKVNRVKCRLEYIANPLRIIEKDESGSPVLLLRPAVAAMGSLTKQKGFDRLLEIFEGAAGKHSDVSLYIIGEGSQRQELERLISEKKLCDRVFLLGRKKSPEQILKQADAFTFTSYYEGFPNALLEAMALGLAVVSFDVESGPSDMIENMVNGVLVPDGDKELFVEKLNLLLEDGELRAGLGAEAKKVNNRFGIEHIAGQWESLITEFMK